jgi:hypothetical protein
MEHCFRMDFDDHVSDELFGKADLFAGDVVVVNVERGFDDEVYLTRLS